MAGLKVKKVIATLPGTLEANTIYLVRAGAGFDFHVTDATGTVAYTQNLTIPEEVLLELDRKSRKNAMIFGG